MNFDFPNEKLAEILPDEFRLKSLTVTQIEVRLSKMFEEDEIEINILGVKIRGEKKPQTQQAPPQPERLPMEPLTAPTTGFGRVYDLLYQYKDIAAATDVLDDIAATLPPGFPMVEFFRSEFERLSAPAPVVDQCPAIRKFLNAAIPVKEDQIHLFMWLRNQIDGFQIRGLSDTLVIIGPKESGKTTLGNLLWDVIRADGPPTELTHEQIRLKNVVDEMSWHAKEKGGDKVFIYTCNSDDYPKISAAVQDECNPINVKINNQIMLKIPQFSFPAAEILFLRKWLLSLDPIEFTRHGGAHLLPPNPTGDETEL